MKKLKIISTTDSKHVNEILTVDDIYDLKYYNDRYKQKFYEIQKHDGHYYIISSNYTLKLLVIK